MNKKKPWELEFIIKVRNILFSLLSFYGFFYLLEKYLLHKYDELIPVWIFIPSMGLLALFLLFLNISLYLKKGDKDGK